MTASPPHPVAGIDLGPPTLSVAVRTATGVRVQACPEPVGGGTAGLTVDHSAGEPRTSAEVVDHLGERVFLPVCDTYYPAAALLTALLAAVRRTAEQMERGSGRCAAVAHPVDWPAWRLRALEAAVRAAGFDAVDLVPAPEAAAWAPTAGPAPDPGLVLVFDLSDTPSVALLRPDGDGLHLIAHRPLHPADRPTDVARALLDGAGHRLAEVSDVRAVGAGATEAQTQQIGDELATIVRVPRFPESAVAVGALHRSLWSRRAQPVPDTAEHNSSTPQPVPDIAEPVPDTTEHNSSTPQPVPDSAQPVPDPASVPSGSDAPTVPIPLAPRERRSRPAWPRRKLAWVGAGVAAAILAIVGLVALLLPGGTPRTSELEREFPVSAEAIDTVVAAERDGKPVVISGGNVHAIQVSNPVDGTQLGSWPVDDAVQSLAVESPATSAGPPPVVVSASPNHAVHVFDPQSGKQLGMWSQPNVPVTAIATADSGGRPTVVCGGGDGTLTFWWTDGRQRAYPPVPASGNTASNVSALAVGQVGGRGVVGVRRVRDDQRVGPGHRRPAMVQDRHRRCQPALRHVGRDRATGRAAGRGCRRRRRRQQGR